MVLKKFEEFEDNDNIRIMKQSELGDHLSAEVYVNQKGGRFPYVLKDYPTIDHKISVLHGFMNDISPKEISHIDNLCITKRTINSQKGSVNEEEYFNSVL